MPADVIDRDVRPRMPRLQQLLWIPMAVFAVWAIWLALFSDDPDRHPVLIIILATTALAQVVNTRLPRRVVVDEAGVKLPFKRVLPWSEITSVKKPGPYTGTVTLRRRDGTETYTGLPVEDSEAVARIGGVPLE